MGWTLEALARRFGLELAGDAATAIAGVCTLHPGKPGHLSFLANPRYRAHLATTAAAAVVVDARHAAELKRPGLIAPDPYLAFARIARLFEPDATLEPGIHPSAIVDAGAEIAAGAQVGPHAVIASGAQIGESAYVGPGCTIGERAQIGAQTRLDARVYVGARVRIGRRCRLQAGAVVGSRGFGFARGPQGWEDVPQLGTVAIGDDVEIGANTTIDRGTLDDTVIEDGVKLDNQIQIAHNVVIGAHTAIAACTGIAGSARIGRRCMIGGAVGINGHIAIADDVVILGRAMVTKSLPRPGVYASGLPATKADEWRDQVARVRRLAKLERRLAALERSFEKTVQDNGKKLD